MPSFKRSCWPCRGLAWFVVLTTAALAGCTDKSTPQQTAPSIEKLTAAEAALKAKLPTEVTPDNHSWVMDAILGKPKHEIHQIGILVYDGVNDLDFTGPRYVLGQSGAKVRLIGIKPGPIKTVMGMQVVPDTVIDEVQRLDILIVPGGFTGTIEAAYDERVINWIRAIDKGTTYTGAVCTGVWILGATGLLEGRHASSNWYRHDEFLQKYKAIPSPRRWTQDGKYWTAAGVTAGLDMSLALLNDNWGERYTQGVMLDMEYDPQPPIQGGTPQKTGMLVEWMMKAMYDAGVNPLIDKLEKQKAQGGPLASSQEAQAVRHVLVTKFDRPEAPLQVAPVVVSGEHALAGWIQGARGGRALLRRVQGQWQIVVCGGDGLKDRQLLRDAGVPGADASALAAAMDHAEQPLSAAQRKLLSSFEGLMRMDGGENPAHH